jgi:hypothetical protein
VTSSEPDDLPGSRDGHTTGDISGADLDTPDTAVNLRAERDAAGTGRVYRLTYRARDAAGNATEAVSLVTVPRSLHAGPTPTIRPEDFRQPGSTRDVDHHGHSHHRGGRANDKGGS